MKKKSLNVQKKIHNSYQNLLNKSLLKSFFYKFEKKLNSNEKYLVAVSGGPDSLALAFLSKCFEIKYRKTFIYCIVDHQLRAESSKEAKKVCKILRRINVKCKILKWSGKKPSSNIQYIARLKRFALLEKECSKSKIKNILLGHQKDDLNENFFIRMTRGSGLKGLVSFGEKSKMNNFNYIRPLLDFNKNDLKKISLEVFNFFVEDPSNNNDSFKRIRIRKLISVLEQEGLDKKKINLTIKNLKEANNALDYYALKNVEENSCFQLKSEKVTLTSNFLKQPSEIILRSLNIVIQQISKKFYPPRGKSTKKLIADLKSQNRLKKMTLGGCLFKKVNETIIILKERG